MAQRISPLQMYEAKDWAGLTTKNHLASIYQVEPQFASKLVNRIFQVNNQIDLDTYLNKFQPMYLDTDDDFKWLLQGYGDKNVPLVEARLTLTGSAISATDEPGKNFTRFYVVFPERYFSDTQIIVGEDHELYPLRIVSEPISEGSLSVYEVELMTGDPDLFMPYEKLQSGKRFSKNWSPVSDTLSVKGGTPNYTSPFQMVNTFSMMRMMDKRPGNMISRPVAFSWIGENGKTMSTWMQYADYQFERQFRKQKSKMLMYATSNKASDGTYKQKDVSGYEIKQGAGIKQQMESANVAYYNTFSIEWLTEMLLDISVNRLDETDREFVLLTGEWGMYQFHKALQNYSQLYTPIRNESRIKSVGGNGLQYNGQFVEYMGPQGVKVTLMHDPTKDDIERNIIRHPDGGLANSYVYDILDMGKVSNGTPNVRKVYVKGADDVLGYVPGLRNPFTPDLKNSMMANSVDGYEIHRMTQCGAMVQDPTRTMSIKPSIINY